MIGIDWPILHLRYNMLTTAVSRVMVHLFSRLTRLIARVKKSGRNITEADLPSSDPETNSALSSLLNFSLDPLEIEARQLNSDVNAWIESLQLATLEHERVQVGNRAYAYAMKVGSASLLVIGTRCDWPHRRMDSALAEKPNTKILNNADLRSYFFAWSSITHERTPGCRTPLSKS
jgi:hypothetical protein